MSHATLLVAREPIGPDLTPHSFLRLFPTPSEVVPEELIHDDLWDCSQDRNSSGRPKVLINMVSSLDGRISVDGKAGAIGGVADRRLMRILRSRVDAVMFGAGTLRSEKISLGVPLDLSLLRTSRSLPEQPIHIILSGIQEPELDNIVDPIPDRTILFMREGMKTDEEGSSSPIMGEIVEVPVNSQGMVDLHAALAILHREQGVRTLLVEGGPSLNHSLIVQGLVDEIHLTLAPKILGGDTEPPASIVNGPFTNPHAKHELISIYTPCEAPGSLELDLFLRYKLTKRDRAEDPSVSDK